MLIGTSQKVERFDHEPAATPYMISAGTDCEIKRVRVVKYLGLILSIDHIKQWITSTRIIQDRWIWRICIFPGLCAAVHGY